MKVGDRVVVTSPLSSFIGRTGTLRELSLRNEGGHFTPFQCLVEIDDYCSPSHVGVPFMEYEIRLLPPADTAGPSDSVASSMGDLRYE